MECLSCFVVFSLPLYHVAFTIIAFHSSSAPYRKKSELWTEENRTYTFEQNLCYRGVCVRINTMTIRWLLGDSMHACKYLFSTDIIMLMIMSHEVIWKLEWIWTEKSHFSLIGIFPVFNIVVIQINSRRHNEWRAHVQGATVAEQCMHKKHSSVVLIRNQKSTNNFVFIKIRTKRSTKKSGERRMHRLDFPSLCIYQYFW